ncbi:MAG: hypothetical protein EOO46_22480 [Flavobacterium sp.]|nr:MAG: hypothetical protein EOO46_22480 [Flavobacterium sp.]
MKSTIVNKITLMRQMFDSKMEDGPEFRKFSQVLFNMEESINPNEENTFRDNKSSFKLFESQAIERKFSLLDINIKTNELAKKGPKGFKILGIGNSDFRYY